MGIGESIASFELVECRLRKSFQLLPPLLPFLYIPILVAHNIVGVPAGVFFHELTVEAKLISFQGSITKNIRHFFQTVACLSQRESKEIELPFPGRIRLYGGGLRKTSLSTLLPAPDVGRIPEPSIGTLKAPAVTFEVV
jgi:hypothetical protein